MAEDILALRTQVASLEEQNSQLRSELSMNHELGRTLLDDTDIDVMTKAEITDRIGRTFFSRSLLLSVSSDWQVLLFVFFFFSVYIVNSFYIYLFQHCKVIKFIYDLHSISRYMYIEMLMVRLK